MSKSEWLQHPETKNILDEIDDAMGHAMENLVNINISDKDHLAHNYSKYRGMIDALDQIRYLITYQEDAEEKESKDDNHKF